MPSSSPSKEPNASASREDSFGTGSHPAYSSFSHIEGVSNLAFSVGLREDQAVADEIVSKILPMSKIVPGEPVERRIRRLMADLGDTDLEAAALEIPEYVELQDRLRELTTANAACARRSRTSRARSSSRRTSRRSPSGTRRRSRRTTTSSARSSTR